MLIRVFCILMLLAFSHNALADSCSEPAEPDCAANEETYKNKEAYDTCTKEFEAMSKKTKAYIDCMKDDLKKTADDVQKKADTATDKLNSSIKKFNCRANPKAAC